MPDLPAWVGLLNSVVGGLVLGLVLWLWLTGVLVRGKDVDVRLAERDHSHEHEIELVRSAHADQVTALNLSHDNRIKFLTRQLEAETADKTAWRSAHSEEAAARRAAESAAQQVMESGNVTMAILSALKDSLARTPPSQGPERAT